MHRFTALEQGHKEDMLNAEILQKNAVARAVVESREENAAFLTPGDGRPLSSAVVGSPARSEHTARSHGSRALGSLAGGIPDDAYMPGETASGRSRAPLSAYIGSPHTRSEAPEASLLETTAACSADVPAVVATAPVAMAYTKTVTVAGTEAGVGAATSSGRPPWRRRRW